MPFTPLEAAAARKAIFSGDDTALERYLREGGSSPISSPATAQVSGTLTTGTTLINKPTGGFVFTLPPATGSQNVVRVVISTAITSGNGIIKTASAADFMTGLLTYGTATFGAGSSHAVGGTNALITLVAASGGQKGTVLTFTDIATNLWLVDGLLASTTSASVVGPWA
jgi:hypothetical protein